MKRTRRELLGDAWITAAAATVVAGRPADAASPAGGEQNGGDDVAGEAEGEPLASRSDTLPIVDTNVHLFRWPFRRFRHDSPRSLVRHLKTLGITQAWAGSFEALLHRDIAGVNERLANACREVGGAGIGVENFLVPVGAVDPMLPDWREDLRRCREQHRMVAIRIYPGYHDYRLDHPEFEQLLAAVTARGMLLQLVVSLEDLRTQHPRFRVADVDLGPLPDLLARHASARVMLLNHRPGGAVFERLTQRPEVYFDTARVEATDGIAKLVRGAAGRRVLMGSHSPFFIPESQLIRIDESRLDRDRFRHLVGGGASRLLSELTVAAGRVPAAEGES